MKLYHFSNVDTDELKPEFFGHNAFTGNDAKYKVPRVFFYTKKTPAERRFEGCSFRYEITCPEKVYNLKEDKLHLVKNFPDITELLEYCKKHFAGVLYNVGFDVVCLFGTIKPEKKIQLKK